ncbi:alpha/beta hydrolase domain-containing protein [Streptomyces phaeochromogenes]|uniref:Alpha/beta hydrolase domain-containing protein n=1 Tax=Streptomyces phaeochromogenes TaxID=1923 RepID=A0ABZ1HAY5_STRPH|nr:alpha/beta hydrolase domain-containing protein [Streptomyces phaeochromogenes]WSD14344.1 alpha/beta hydrolase domain-containing protein [Streptomyces phaeochromogenes]
MGTLVSVCGPSSATPRTAATAKSLPVSAAKLTEVRVPGTKPMSAAAVDLAKAGYTEREFYAEGKAHRFRGAVDRTLKTAEVIDGNWSYRTRVLVRTPKPEHFNGTLVVEWTNVTLGQDADFAFAEAHEYLLRQGYAVAVVSAQNVGVERLKTWSPERYGSLSVAADNTDPQGGGTIDARNDPLSFDIMTQVSKALKNNVGDKAGNNRPLPRMKVRDVIAMGQSQSGIRLTNYYNTIQPLYNFFDGFVYWDRSDQLRSDLPVPAISVNSEAIYEGWPVVTTSKYTRAWDVAGASHASLYASQYIDDMVVRDKSLAGPDGPRSFTDLVEAEGCDLNPPFSTVDNGLVVNTAIDSVRRWITTGKPAAPSRYFELDSSGALARDANGKVRGGIRLAQFTAPTAFTAPNGPGFLCSLSGHHRDYTAAELKGLYKTHQNYVAQVRDTMRDARKDGYILKFDETTAVRAAEASNVAR